MSIFDVEGHMCICTDRSVTIVDSNDIPDNDINRFLDILRNKIDKNPKLKDRYKRSVKSWEEEWISYNKIHRIKMFKLSTKDIKFSENKSIILLTIYKFLGRNK